MALLTPLPYLLLQLIGFSPTSFSFCYNPTMMGYALFCSSIGCPLSWSPLFLTPPQPSHGQVQPAGHVQSNFSLCCVLFQMPLAFFSFMSIIKTFCLTIPWGGHAFRLYNYTLENFWDVKVLRFLVKNEKLNTIIWIPLKWATGVVLEINQQSKDIKREKYGNAMLELGM